MPSGCRIPVDDVRVPAASPWYRLPRVLFNAEEPLTMKWSGCPVAKAKYRQLHRVLDRDGRRCAYCLVPLVCWCDEWAFVRSGPHSCHLVEGVELALREHVLPRSRGGSDDDSNIVPACNRCNCAKGTRTPDEWRKAQQAKAARA